MNQAIKSITIFLSYCHLNKGLAEKIEADLKMMGIRVIRDAHYLKYTDRISRFMQNIREADYALLLISDPYLRSRNCMFEVSQLLKDQDAWNKLLPVVVNETKIYTPVERLEYIKHWQQQQETLRTGLLGIDTTNALSSYGELKQLGEIAGLIDDFLTRIVDMYHVSYQALIEQKYKPLFDKLGFMDITFLLSLLSIKEVKDPEMKSIALDDYLARFGPNTFYYCFRASLDKQLGQYKKAIYSYQRALAIDPDVLTPFREPVLTGV